MPARKICREVIRYEVDEHDLAEVLEIPDDLEIASITFHNKVLRIFTVTKQTVTDYSQESESQNDDQASIPK